MRRGAVCGRRRGCDAAPAPHTQRTAGKGCKKAWRGAWRGRGHHVDSSGSFRGGRGQLRPSRTRGWHSLRARPPPPTLGGGCQSRACVGAGISHPISEFRHQNVVLVLRPLSGARNWAQKVGPPAFSEEVAPPSATRSAHFLGRNPGPFFSRKSRFPGVTGGRRFRGCAHPLRPLPVHGRSPAGSRSPDSKVWGPELP